MGNGFTKLFSSIVSSSIWEEDNYTRIVWITMLAMADKDGNVMCDIRRFAKMANIPLNKCKMAISKLSTPDPSSRTPDNEGRRIKSVQGGWFILNYQLYREKARATKRRKYLRDKKREERAKKPDVNTMSTTVNNSPHCQPIAEAEAEAEADNSAAAQLTRDFDDFWKDVPHKIGKGKARKAYLKARKKASKEKIHAGLPKYQAYEKQREEQNRTGDFRPLHPATWLNEGRWDDELTTQHESTAEQIAKIRAEQ